MTPVLDLPGSAPLSRAAALGTSHRGDDLVSSASVCDRSRHEDRLNKDTAALLLLIGLSPIAGGQPPLGTGGSRGRQRELILITSRSGGAPMDRKALLSWFNGAERFAKDFQEISR